jgi:hypothetical protein
LRFIKARRVRDKNIEAREARAKLLPRGKPSASARASIFDTARGKRGGAWVVRRYLGDQDYKVETIATADDVAGRQRRRRSRLLGKLKRLPGTCGPELCRMLKVTSSPTL